MIEKKYLHFIAEISMLTKAEGGRFTPFFSGYYPQFYIENIAITGYVQLPKDVYLVSPGENAIIEVRLNTKWPLAKGQDFTIREGIRTVGGGKITELLD